MSAKILATLPNREHRGASYPDAAAVDDIEHLGLRPYNGERARELIAKLPEDNIRRMGKYAQRTRVTRMARAMLRGDWTVSHEGILLNLDDRPLDGAGRLLAVIEADKVEPGKVIYLRTFRRKTRIENARDLHIDEGDPRSAAYILQEHQQLVQMARLAFATALKRPPDVVELKPFTERYERIFSMLDSRKKHGFGNAAPIHLAAVMSIVFRRARPEYIEDVLSAFARRDPRAIPPLPYSFYRQVTEKDISDTRQKLVRAWRAFRECNKDLMRLQIKDEYAVLLEIREHLLQMVPEWQGLEQ